VTSEPIAVGLVGTGPWAGMFHAPMLAAGPQTRLAVVHGRRRDAAESLAAQYGARGTDDLDELVASCQAVAFAVPPDVQVGLAPVAARAGLPLLLEKPVGLDLASARQLAEDLGDVPTMLMLRARFSPRTRGFLSRAESFRAEGLTLLSASGALLGSNPFGTPWRRAHGALLDVGPHALDLVEAAAGPIVDIAATGSSLGWLALTTRHASGTVGQVALSLGVGVAEGMFQCTLFGPEGIVALPPVDADDGPATTACVRAEFADVVTSGVSHPLDVRHGVHLQELIEAAARQLAR
jgi:predicted dehydrogenase